MPLRNAPSLSLAKISSIGARLTGAVPTLPTVTADAQDLQSRLHTALRDNRFVLAYESVALRARALAWHNTGITLRRGQEVTLIAEGTVHLARALRLSLQPKAALWWRVGDGHLHAVSGNACTFSADADGTLELTALPPGSFADEAGTVERTPLHALMSGKLAVGIIRWADDAAGGLQTAQARDPATFSDALRQHTQPVQPPRDWRYLWRLGDAEIYRTEHADGCTQIGCHTDGDVGILQYPIELPLTPGLQLEWSWCVQQLPSERAEHIDLTHDYLSIAIAFDNGLDLTYMWSATMPNGTVFQCPLPYWKERETHWVVRCQKTDPLDQWLSEARDVFADYAIAIGGPMPQKVVSVWLIANSLFQRRPGHCAYRDIRLRADDGVHEVVIAPARVAD